MFSTKQTIAYVISCAIFITLSWWLSHHIAPTNPHCDTDSSAYLYRGNLFYQTNQFVTPDQPEQPYYTLGYPLIIGLLYKAVGGPSTAALIFLQLLLALLSCLLIMRLANRFFGSTAAIIAAFLFALNVGYLTFTQFVLTEIILSFLILLFFERLTSQHPGQAALVLGCSIIVKPAALYLVIPIAGWLLITAAGSIAKRLLMVTMLSACFALPVVGYMTYNYAAFGNFKLGSLDRVNLHYWFLSNVLAAKNGTTADSERSQLLALSLVDDGNQLAALFWSTLRENPALMVRVWLTNVVKTAIGLYTTNLKVLVEPGVHGGDVSFFKSKSIWGYIKAGATKPWVVAVGCYEVVYSLLRYVCCLLALLILYRRRQYALLVLCIGVLGYFFMITGHDGCARFRMMVEWLLIVLAAGGLASLFDGVRWRGSV